MSHTLLLRYSDQDDQKQWLLLDGNGAIIDGPHQGGWEQLPEQRFNQQVTVIFPSHDIAINHCRIAKTTVNKLRQAVPYALEEQIAEDVDACHFALGDFQDNGDLAVAIVNKTKLQHWLKQLEQYNITADTAVVEALTLPHEANSWSVLFVQNHVQVRTGNAAAFCCALENLATFMTLALQQHSQNLPSKINVYHYDPQVHGNLSALYDFDVDVNILQTNAELIELFAQGIQQHSALNLLQGQFQPQKSLQQLKRQWLLPACLAATLVVVMLLAVVTEVTVWQLQKKHYQHKVAAIYQQIFPGATSVVAPRERISQKIKTLQDGGKASSFLTLLGHIGRTLRAHSDMKLLSLNFNNHRLIVNIEAQDFNSLQQLTSRLRREHYRVKQYNATTKGTRVQANLEISK